MLLQGNEPENDSLTITQEGKVMASVNRSEHALDVFPLLDMDKYEQWVDKLDRKTYMEARNAKIGSSGQIIPGQNGHRLTDASYWNNTTRIGTAPALLPSKRRGIRSIRKWIPSCWLPFVSNPSATM